MKSRRWNVAAVELFSAPFFSKTPTRLHFQNFSYKIQYKLNIRKVIKMKSYIYETDPNHAKSQVCNECFWALISFPLGCRGSACVELMTTLQGSSPYFLRHVGGCVPLEGTIAPSRDPFKRPTHPCLFRATIDLLG